MIVQELIGDGLVRTYSDLGVLIHGGVPEGDYAEAVDLASLNRVYTETNIPIDYEEDNPEAEYAIAGHILMGETE